MDLRKSGMIALVGRPNVGKSTLTNALVGEKIAIVTNKPQTTRNRLCAIVNREPTQFVFVDTPGLHRARTKLGEYMVDVIRQSVADVDAVCLLVEPVPNVGGPEAELIQRIRKLGVPAVLVINKTDTVKKEDLLAVIAAYADELDWAAILPMCAKEGEGVVTWFDHFAKQAEDNVKQVLACCEAAYAAGIELDEDDLAVIEGELAAFDAYAAQVGYSTNAYVGMMFGEGVRLKDVEKMMKLTQLATKWTSMKSEEFFNGVTLDQITAYYNENQDKYDAFCDIIGYSFTASFTPDKNGDATKNAELAAEYKKDQERFAGYLAKMKEAKTREELNGILLGCLEDEEKYQLLKGKAEGYELTDADYTAISTAANKKFEGAYMENVADNDFSNTLSALDTWLFESKKENDKTVYQRKPGDTKEINDASNVVTDNEEAEKNYKAVSSTYGYYIFINGMHRDFSPSVGHILFKNATFDGQVNSNKLTGVAKVLADRLFKENKDVANYVLTADAMAAELVEVMKEAGKVTEATRPDGSTYNKISKEVFETYGKNYTEDSNVFYDGVARGVMVEPFEDWAYDSKRVVGEISNEGIETDYGYHVMFYSGVAWESGIRDTLATEANDAYLESIQEGMNITIKSENYSRITG